MLCGLIPLWGQAATVVDSLLPTPQAIPVAVAVNGQTATLFIGGAVFNGKEKPKQRNLNFTQNLIYRLNAFFSNNGRYRTVKKSKRFLGAIRNSIYSLKFGHAVLDTKKLGKKGKHRAMRKTITEIYDFSGMCANDYRRVNIIGSSYGSVVAAQIALHLIEVDNQSVNALVLSASPIDSLNSFLGQQLKTYNKNGAIGQIHWLPNLNDNIMGASGNLSVWKVAFPSAASGHKSILNPYHPHNLARKNLGRTVVIMDTLTNQIITSPTAYRQIQLDDEENTVHNTAGWDN